MNDEEDDNNVEYKLVYSTLHQQRIKVPIKSDSSMTYKQLLSKIDSGTINTKSSNRSNHYFIQATTNVQISEKNMKNFIIWQQYIISSLICYQPLRIHDHLSEYDDDFLNRTVIFEDIKNSLFLVQEDYSRIRLVIRSLQSLGICAYYSEDSNSIYHKHTINMNCSSDYIFNNWISYIESYVYHNNYTGVDNLDSLRNGSIDDILSRRILLSPIMFSSKLKRQYHTCKSGNNATQLTFIRRLLFGLIESPQLLYETKIELLSCILHLNSEIYMLSRGHVTFNAACHDELLKSNNESVIRKMEHFQKHMRVDVIDMTLWYDYILCALYRGEDRVVSKYLDDLFYKIDTEYITAKDFSEILQLKGAIKLYHLAMYWVSSKNINKERQCKIIIILGNILINGGCGYYSRHLLSTYEEGNDDGEEEISIPNTFNIDKFNYFKQSIDEEINKYKRKLFEARAAHNIFYHNSFAQQTPSIVTKVDATLDIYYAINCFIFYFFYGNYSINLSSYEAVIHQIELTDKMYKAYIYSLINLYINKTHINGSNLHEIENILGSMKSQIEVSLLVTIERLFHARVLFLINIRVLLCPFVPDFLVGQSIFRSILDALNHFPSSTVFLSLRHCEESRHKSFKYDIKLNSNIGYVPTNAAILMNKLTTKIWSVSIIEKLRHDNNCIDHTLFANWSHESIEHLRKTIENLLVIEVAKQIPVVWLLYLTLEISIGNYKDARHIYYRALQSTSWSKDIWLFLYCLNRYSVFTDKEIDEFIHIMKLRGV